MGAAPDQQENYRIHVRGAIIKRGPIEPSYLRLIIWAPSATVGFACVFGLFEGHEYSLEERRNSPYSNRIWRYAGRTLAEVV